MSIARPTAGGVIFALLAAAAVGTAVMNVGLMTALAGTVLCGVWLSSFVLAQLSLRGVKIERLNAADSPGGSPAVLPLQVTNSSFVYRQPVIVREKFDFYAKKVFNAATPPLAPRETLVLNRIVPADRRGRCKLDKVSVIGGDPCGFFRKTRVFHLPGEITITPRIAGLESLPVCHRRNANDGGEGNLLGHAGIGGDFFGVRPYRPGDEIRHVHWRSTAAKHKLMVREFEASVTDRIYLFLDTCAAGVGQDGEDNNFEALVSAGASIADYLSTRYCHLCLMTEFEHDSRILLNGDAAGVRLKIIEALTEIRPGAAPLEPLLCDAAEHIFSGDTVFILTMTQSAELHELMRMLTDVGVMVNWIFAPPEYFPPVEPDIPRTLPRRETAVLPGAPVKPLVLNFKSNLSELLTSDNVYEKI